MYLIKKYMKYKYTIIILLICGICIIFDYYNIFKIGIFSSYKYSDNIGSLEYSFNYSRKLGVKGDHEFLQITKPIYWGENKPLIEVLFYKNGEFNNTEPFDNLLSWYKDYNYGDIENQDIK